jgi:NAD(P)-dependent dehydrogenase (short-subunit alcohol dehydrogenase family)
MEVGRPSWKECAMSEFEGRVAIVTGGGSGIGEACAHLLAMRGARVLVADHHADAAARVAEAIGEAAAPFVGDVSDPEACNAMVAEAVSTFGGLHVAVNNAGIGGEQNPIGAYSVEGWRTVLSVNLDGVFYCMRAQLPVMIEGGGGSIVNMSSILGSVGFASAGAYVAAKHGVVGLTRAAAIDHAADGVRINAVGPGFIDTPLLAAAPKEMIEGIAALHPLGRLGTSEEVAELVAFLASNRSSNTTGAYFTTDGGYTAR